MRYLAIVSLLWAFSFGLIGMLKGIDPVVVATLRLGLALAVFLPFLRYRSVPVPDRLRLMGCGAVQFGLMYVCYIEAFRYLPSHLVALFSILTPLYVAIIYNLRAGRFQSRPLWAALLSIFGAAVIKAKSGEHGSIWAGFLLMQIAGIGFAFGQLYYRDWKQRHDQIPDSRVFAFLYAGGFGFALMCSLLLGNWGSFQPDGAQILVLLFLGLIASGLGFFLWNKGASVSRGGTLAAFNNAVVPLGMFCSLFIFREIGDITGEQVIRLIIGGGLIGAAVWWAERKGSERFGKPI